jgi:hypothetical protein
VWVLALTPSGIKTPSFIFCFRARESRDVERLRRFEREQPTTPGQDAAGAGAHCSPSIQVNDQNCADTARLLKMQRQCAKEPPL